MEAKIISLGYAVPKYQYTQREIFDALGYPSHFWRLFDSRNSGIEKRHFCLPIEQIKRLSFQEQQETYQKEAVNLSKQAIINCLDGRDVSDIGCLVFSSCTGLAPGPTIGDYLVKELGLLPSVRVVNNVSQGCEGGGYPGLSTAVDFVVAHNKSALVVACELSGLTHYPEPDGKPIRENDYQLLRANAIFGEASSATLIGHDYNLRHPFIIDQESYTNTDYIDELGYRWRDGRLAVLLSKRVPELAPQVVKPAVEALLGRQKLSVSDINWWVIHAAGLSVINNIQKALGIAEDKLELSLETLHKYGNVSSATVGLVGKRLMSENISSGDLLMIVTVGPGIRGGASILEFRGC